MKSSFRDLGVVRIVKSVTTTDEAKKTFIYVEHVNGRKVIRVSKIRTTNTNHVN